MHENAETLVRDRVVRWLEDVVIGLNLCPFARQPWVRQQVTIELCPSGGHESVLEFCMTQMHRLNGTPAEDIDSMLLVLAEGYEDFSDYLDILEELNALIDLSGWRGHLQLASFHPLYQFEGTQLEDRENYTNRAPYPIVHVLREDSVERARALHPDTEGIPEDNIRRLENLSETDFRRLFTGGKDC
ncbi:MAG: DUF1415 domain-containing protein [Oleiphilus sp.]|nr:MAG: DUF1415 domain-containing protein [Oleiphilus sp.]